MHQADSCPIKHAIWINSILLLSLYGKANPLFVVFVISRPSAISGAFSVPGLELLICPLPEAAAGSNLQGPSSVRAGAQLTGAEGWNLAQQCCSIFLVTSGPAALFPLLFGALITR